MASKEALVSQDVVATLMPFQVGNEGNLLFKDPTNTVDGWYLSDESHAPNFSLAEHGFQHRKVWAGTFVQIIALDPELTNVTKFPECTSGKGVILRDNNDSLIYCSPQALNDIKGLIPSKTYQEWERKRFDQKQGASGYFRA